MREIPKQWLATRVSVAEAEHANCVMDRPFGDHYGTPYSSLTEDINREIALFFGLKFSNSHTTFRQIVVVRIPVFRLSTAVRHGYIRSLI